MIPVQTAVTDVALFLDPPTHHFERDRLFSPQTATFGGDDQNAPYRLLRDTLADAGVPVHTADLLDDGALEAARRPRKLFVSLGGVERYRGLADRKDVVLSALFMMECPIVDPRVYRQLGNAATRFRRMYTWSDAETLEPFVGKRLQWHSFRWPQARDGVVSELWGREERGFLVMINANKLPQLYVQELYTARLRAVEYFHRFGEIDLYGRNWDRMPNRVGTRVPVLARRAYRRFWEFRQRHWPDPLYAAAAGATRGPTPAKLETLSHYDFALCFENATLRGWITEKLFDCLFAGTIPIYWGAPDISEYVDPHCFIDMREFGGFAELREHLRSLDRAAIRRLREAGRNYLESEQFAAFQPGAFVDLFRRLVEEDAAVPVAA